MRVESGFMGRQCAKCKRAIGAIGNKTLFCKNCGTLLTESLFTDKNEITKFCIDQIDKNSKKISIDISIETDEHNKIIKVNYPNLDFILGKILK